MNHKFVTKLRFEPKLKGKRFFIVEDNLMNRTVYQILLRTHGAKVEFDRWGRDTTFLMKTFDDIDLIILDLMLPTGDDGFKIFEQIREISTHNHIPIIAVSASDPSSAIPKAQKLGFSGFIAKPINDELFPDQLIRILNGENIWHAGEHFS